MNLSRFIVRIVQGAGSGGEKLVSFAGMAVLENGAAAGGEILPLPSSASREIGECHLPPEGEGRGNAHRPCRGRRPDAPVAHGNDLPPPTANPHTAGRERRPRRSTQQHKTEASRQANPHPPIRRIHPRCRARRPRRALQRRDADLPGLFARPKRPHPFPPPAGHRR